SSSTCPTATATGSISRADRPSRRSPVTAIRSRHAPIALAACLLAVIATAAPPLAAQGLHLSGLHGEQLADADLARGPTIAVIWASWSPRSRDVVERVNALAGRWAGQARVITVDFQEDRAAVERFLAGKSLAAPVFLDSDGAFSKKYAVATLP